MRPSIEELIERPLLSNDYALEVFNKMTTEEIQSWDGYVTDKLIVEGVPDKFPDLNAARLAKDIDLSILYDIIKKIRDEK